MSKYDNIKPADIAKMSKDEVTAYVAHLQAEKAEADAKVAALQAAERGISFKPATKGGLSVLGLNAKFPVTLYKEQWLRLLEGVETYAKGSTFAKFMAALENPELSQGKDDPRYTGEALAKREADAAAKREAKNGKTDTKVAAQDTPQDMKPRLAPAPANT
jgi:cytochrome c1